MLNETKLEGVMRSLRQGIKLNVLYLVYQRLSVSELENLFELMQEFPVIKKMLLVRNKMGPELAEPIANLLQSAYPIELLDLSHNNFGDVGLHAIAGAIPAARTLTHFDISNNGVSDSGITDLANMLESDHGLKSLSIAQNPCSPESLMGLSQSIQAQQQLTHLNCSQIKMGDKGAQALAYVLMNPVLAQINLSNCLIGPVGAQCLAAVLTKKTQLKRLLLASNHIGNKGMRYMAQMLQFNQTLEQVDLQNNTIDNEGALDLIRILHDNNTLLEINLKGNAINDALLEDIEKVTLRNRKNKEIHATITRYLGSDQLHLNTLLNLRMQSYALRRLNYPDIDYLIREITNKIARCYVYCDDLIAAWHELEAYVYYDDYTRLLLAEGLIKQQQEYDCDDAKLGLLLLKELPGSKQRDVLIAKAYTKIIRKKFPENNRGISKQLLRKILQKAKDFLESYAKEKKTNAEDLTERAQFFNYLISHIDQVSPQQMRLLNGNMFIRQGVSALTKMANVFLIEHLVHRPQEAELKPVKPITFKNLCQKISFESEPRFEEIIMESELIDKFKSQHMLHLQLLGCARALFKKVEQNKNILPPEINREMMKIYFDNISLTEKSIDVIYMLMSYAFGDKLQTHQAYWVADVFIQTLADEMSHLESDVRVNVLKYIDQQVKASHFNGISRWEIEFIRTVSMAEPEQFSFLNHVKQVYLDWFVFTKFKYCRNATLRKKIYDRLSSHDMQELDKRFRAPL